MNPKSARFDTTSEILMTGKDDVHDVHIAVNADDWGDADDTDDADDRGDAADTNDADDWGDARNTPLYYFHFLSMLQSAS